jgi:hypothetical protein
MSCRQVKVTTDIFSLKNVLRNVFYYSVINESLRRVGFRNVMQYADYEMTLREVFWSNVQLDVRRNDF